MNKGLEYSTSRGSILADRGPRNMVPVHNYPSGTGKSIVWRGAAYYVPSENRWIQQCDYRSMPREARRDAIYFESEDDWVSWKAKSDKPRHPSGISMSGYPTAYTGVPVPTLLPSKVCAINRNWSGAGYFVPTTNRWFHDTDSPGLPQESLQFYNEEDWGISMSGYPTSYTGVPVPTLLPSKVCAINRNWSGAGYFVPTTNRWFHDTDSPGLPQESLQFYNEEDWGKFKYMCENPSMRK